MSRLSCSPVELVISKNETRLAFRPKVYPGTRTCSATLFRAHGPPRVYREEWINPNYLYMTCEQINFTTFNGFGVIQVPLVAVKELLQKGTLVEILPKFRAEPMPVSLVYPHRRNLARRVQLVITWLEKIMREYVS